MKDRSTPRATDSGPLSSTEDAARWLDEHGDALYRYARSRVGNRELAEDLVQDAFLAALRARGRFEGRADVRTWLLSILRHKIVDHYRSAAGRAPTAASEPAGRRDPVQERYFSAAGPWKTAVAPWKSPDQVLEDREFQDVLEGCLGRLPQALGAVFVLREIEGLEMAELRENLALSEGNLRVRLHRARLLLRECLERRWFGGARGRSRGAP